MQRNKKPSVDSPFVSSQSKLPPDLPLLLVPKTSWDDKLLCKLLKMFSLISKIDQGCINFKGLFIAIEILDELLELVGCLVELLNLVAHL